MKLIDDVRGAWRHYSTQALAMAASLQGTWLTIPDSVKADLPAWVSQTVAWIIFSVALAGLGGKFVDQTPKPKEGE